MLSIIVGVVSLFFLIVILRFIFNPNKNEIKFHPESYHKASLDSLKAFADKLEQDPIYKIKKENLIKEFQDSLKNETPSIPTEISIDHEDEFLFDDDSIRGLKKEIIVDNVSKSIINYILNNVEDTTSLNNSIFGYKLLMDTILEYELTAVNEIKTYFNYQISDYDTRSIYLKCSIRAIDEFWRR